MRFVFTIDSGNRAIQSFHPIATAGLVNLIDVRGKVLGLAPEMLITRRMRFLEVEVKRKSSFLVLILAWFGCLCLWGQLGGPNPAIVTGRVLDDRGQPVEGAHIAIMSRGGWSGPMPAAITNKNGYYRLVSPPFGKGWLCAVKESAGYPDTNDLLNLPANGINPRSEVDLTPDSHLDLDFNLGPPNGIVEASVIDAQRRAPIRNGRVRLERPDLEQNAFHSGTIPADGHFLFALPEAPVEITVIAPGYEPWKYKDPIRGTDKLILASGDHRSMTIELTAKQQ